MPNRWRDKRNCSWIKADRYKKHFIEIVVDKLVADDSSDKRLEGICRQA